VEAIFLLLKAVLCGLAVAAPIGPMALLCLRRTIAQGYKCGIATALGIAISDATYAMLAVLGITQIYDFIIQHQSIFHLVVGCFVIFIGITIYRKPSEEAVLDTPTEPMSLPYAFTSAILLTITNPIPLLFFVTIFTTLAPQAGFGEFYSIIVVAGIFTGSFAWFSGVVASVSALRHTINTKRKNTIDKVTGGLLIIFGISELLHLFY